MNKKYASLWQSQTIIIVYHVFYYLIYYLLQLHAMACCLKAVGTADASVSVTSCRLACGGHGYMNCSNLPNIYSLSTATETYEGENTVLLLQTAR